MKAFLRKVLRFQEIRNGAQGQYLNRYKFIYNRWIGLYLHHFVGDDLPSAMHDHPSWFISIGLWGGYLEQTPEGTKVFRAPWVRFFPATHIHRQLLVTANRHCWTLVLRGWKQRTWYFYPNGRPVHWREYLDGTRGAREMKHCDKEKACIGEGACLDGEGGLGYCEVERQA